MKFTIDYKDGSVATLFLNVEMRDGAGYKVTHSVLGKQPPSLDTICLAINNLLEHGIEKARIDDKRTNPGEEGNDNTSEPKEVSSTDWPPIRWKDS